MFEKAKIEIPCPGCGHKSRQRLGDLTRHAQAHILCPGCGRTITVDASAAQGPLEQAAKALDGFRRKLR